MMEENKEELNKLDKLDNSKAIAEKTKTYIYIDIEHFRYYASWSTKDVGETISDAINLFTYTRKEPTGVVGQIIPWNFPLLMAAWKMGAALATGCTIILKPAEQTPLSALYMAKLTQEAGFPEGVFNVVTGFGETGAELVNHPRVNKIA